MANRKRVCFLLNNAYVWDNRVRREAITLTEAGYEVVIFANVAENTKKLPPHETFPEGFSVNRILEKSLFILPPLSSRLLTAVRKVFFGYGRFDVVHAHDAKTLLLGWVLSRLWGAKLVYDSHEHWQSIFEEERLKIDKARIISPAKTIRTREKAVEQYESIESWTLPKCDAAISVCDSIVDMLQTQAQGQLSKTLTLRNIFEHTPVTKQPLFHEHFQLDPSQKIVLYQGNIAAVRGIQYMLEAMKQLRDLPIVLVLMGALRGNYTSQLIQAISQEKAYRDKVYFKQNVPPDILIQWTAAADLGICPVLNWTKTRYYCLPNKVFEYIQGELPFGVSNFPEMKKLVETYDIGFHFNPEDPTEIAQKIRAFFESEERQNHYKTQILKAKATVHWDNEKQRLVELYQSLLPA